MPIYVINDKRIRKAIYRAIMRFRYFNRIDEIQNLAGTNKLEKWSIVLVSNSLRSNLSEMFNQLDLANIKGLILYDSYIYMIHS